MTALTWSHLNRSGRYENNLREIHRKVVAGSPLTTTDGEYFVFDEIEFKVPKRDPVAINISKLSEDAFVAAAKAQAPDFMKNVSVNFKKGNLVLGSGKVHKGVEFGGKPPAGQQLTAKWGRLAELTELLDSSYELNMPSTQEMGELHFINDMNTAIADAIQKEIDNPRSTMDKTCPSLTIKMGKHKFEHIVGVNKVSGTPKADLALVACHNNKLVNVGFISHKMGNQAKDFGQWSGVTRGSAGPEIGDHPEVEAFVEAVRNYTSVNTSWAQVSGFAARRDINDNNLKMYSLYGPDYGKQFGEQNVHVLFQGTPKLTKRAGYYVMDADHVHNNGDNMTGDYIPSLMAIKKGSWEKIIDPTARGVRSDFGIRGMRLSIYPQGGRRVTHTV